MRPTQYIYTRKDGMRLRSGKRINCILNTDVYNDIRNYTDIGLCYVQCNVKTRKTPYRHSGIFDKDNSFNSYCESCYKLIGVLYLAEKYGKDLRGETDIMHGYNKNVTLQQLYICIQDLIERYINQMNENDAVCECNSPQKIELVEKQLLILQKLAKQPKYQNMKDYNGYGPERALYRKYHQDFIKYDFINGQRHAVRDFVKAKEELIHWNKFFKQKHYSIVLKNKQIKKAAKESIKLNKDCINHILSFVY